VAGSNQLQLADKIMDLYFIETYLNKFSLYCSFDTKT